MAILKLQLIGVIIFLVTNLEAQKGPMSRKVATTTATVVTEAPTAAESSSTAAPASFANGGNHTNSTAPDQPMSDHTNSTAPDQPMSDHTNSTAPDQPMSDHTNSTAPDQPMSDPIAQPADNGTEENGGYPFVKPGKHVSGPRHMKGHDGFHNLKNEKHWAKWNDAFTTKKIY